MITAIVTKLKTGTVKNVIRYGQNMGAKAPYIVVRIEKDGLDRGQIVRITGHYDPGQDLFLDEYMDNDVIELLDGFMGVDRFGNHNTLRVLNDYTGINEDNDDSTISKERRFLMPSLTF